DRDRGVLAPGSAAAALHRLARLAQQLGRPADAERWLQEAQAAAQLHDPAAACAMAAELALLSLRLGHLEEARQRSDAGAAQLALVGGDAAAARRAHLHVQVQIAIACGTDAGPAALDLLADPGSRAGP